MLKFGASHKLFSILPYFNFSLFNESLFVFLINGVLFSSANFPNLLSLYLLCHFSPPSSLNSFKSLNNFSTKIFLINPTPSILILPQFPFLNKACALYKKQGFPVRISSVNKKSLIKNFLFCGVVQAQVHLRPCQISMIEFFFAKTVLREKCPNTEFFLVRIFRHSD